MTQHLGELRNLACEYFQAGITAASPRKAIRDSLNNHHNILNDEKKSTGEGQLIYIAVGKAAVPMMAEMIDIHVPDHAMLVTNYENAPNNNNKIHHYCDINLASHPIPDKNGFIAAQKIIDILIKSQENDVIILLLSGGGSALIPAPIENISLEDKIFINNLLITSGADIHQMNKIRKFFSSLKGGGFSQLAMPAQVKALILSDVPSDDMSAVASGLTIACDDNNDDIISIFKDFNLWDKLPHHIQHIVNTKENITPSIDNTKNYMIANNRMCLHAIHHAIGDNYPIIVSEDYLIGDVQQAASQICQDMRHATQQHDYVILLYGGETVVKVTGDGLGGRNQELSLRVALEIEKNPLPNNVTSWVFLSGGSDGIDGITDAAGGIVDHSTIKRLHHLNIDIEGCLANNDSYHVLKACGDLVITGATQTNVADFQIAIISK